MRDIVADFKTAVVAIPANTCTETVKPKKPRQRITRDCPRVTVRFSPEDYVRLQEMADGASLSVYLRAKVLEQKLPRRKRRSVASVADKQAIAQLLGLLGQSRIANNLNQLAYHANIGALPIDDETKSQIAEAYDNVIGMRQTLMKALGQTPV